MCTTQHWPSYDTEMEQSPHDQFCRRNRPALASKWFFHKKLLLDLARVQRPTRWTVALFRTHTHRSMIRHGSYKRLLKHRHRIFPTFLCTNWQVPFLSDCQIVWDPTRRKPFYGQMFMQYWMYAGGRNAQGCLQLTVCQMTILHYLFMYGINVLWQKGCFWRTFKRLVV